MQTSYKPLVERYDIPRPTLIEWQKRAEQKDNWREKLSLSSNATRC